ncbi:AP-3 complex subunit delta, partial [Phytophthora megakarya]
MEFLDDVDDEEDEEDDEDEERETEEEKLQRLEDLSDEMLQPRTTTLPGHVQTVFIQALLKILTAMAERADDATVERIATVIMKRLPAFVQSEYIEVQERAVCLQQLLLALGMGLGALSAQERTERAFDGSASLDPAKRLDMLNSYFVERLAPVGVKAQRKVPLPGDLDLDEPLSNSEAKFLESGGDVSAFSSEDDLEVSFVSQGHAGIGGGYSGIGGDSPERKPGHKHRHHRRINDSSSSESESESESENSADEKEKKEREYALQQERLRKDPFYLSGGSQASADAGANAGFADMMGALGSNSNGKKKKASKKSKSRAVFEDELMPDGARSSDEDRRRSRKKRGSVDEDETDLSAVDLSIPLGDDEKVPTNQWFHRQTPDAKPEDAKKSKKKSSKHKKSSRDEDDGKKKKKESSKSSKSKKSSRKQEESLIGGFSDDEQEPTEAQESRHHHRSSSAKKSSSHKKSRSSKSGDGEKSKGKKKKDKEHKSSKRQEAPPAEPLLLF